MSIIWSKFGWKYISNYSKGWITIQLCTVIHDTVTVCSSNVEFSGLMSPTSIVCVEGKTCLTRLKLQQHLQYIEQL